jgi:hypothetical protein
MLPLLRNGFGETLKESLENPIKIQLIGQVIFSGRENSQPPPTKK